MRLPICLSVFLSSVYLPRTLVYVCLLTYVVVSSSVFIFSRILHICTYAYILMYKVRACVFVCGCTYLMYSFYLSYLGICISDCRIHTQYHRNVHDILHIYVDVHTHLYLSFRVCVCTSCLLLALLILQDLLEAIRIRCFAS